MALKIEIEGTDGAGKTTALKYFIEQLESRGKSVLETREVGSPLIPINVKLREIVLAPESDLCGEAMECVFAAMRFENDKLHKKIGSEYDYIVSDRGWFSHLSYTDHNVDRDFTQGLYIDFLQHKTDLPDIVIYFSINTETGLERRVSRGEGMDVIEMKGVEYQEKVRESFEAYLSDLDNVSPNSKIFLVNANQDIPGVQAQMDEIVEELLNPGSSENVEISG